MLKLTRLFVPLLLLLASSVRAGSSSEYELKAAFLYNFTKYVDFPGEKGPFVIGILGDDPFGSAIDNIVQGKTVNGRSIIVKRLKSEAEGKACGLVFFGADQSDKLSHLTAAFKGSPALTVSDSEGAIQKGVMIELIVEQNKIRFEINNGYAKASHLSISSKLLGLAKQVIQ